MTGSARILVVKLGALGDFVQALGPMAAIRRHHADAHITLMTTGPYANLATASGYVDDLWIDHRPPLTRLGDWQALRRRLRGGGFRRVYDLQTSDRSNFYFRLFWPGPWPEWSGIAKGCSHPHANPGRDAMHTIERQAEQLRMAGITEVPKPDLSWLRADTARFGLPDPYVLLVPGGAAHRPGKRWPIEHYGALASNLVGRGVTPVLLGTADERPLTESVVARCPEARDLAGETGLADIVGLARRATGAVGNDTGSMHLIAVAGCPCVVLYSHASDPALCAQRGPAVTILRRPSLTEIGVEDVLAALPALA